VRGVCAVILAAGEGRRLRPLTEHVPKALCPIGNVPLLDRALQRVGALGFDNPGNLAVNACYLGGQVVAHVGGRARVEVEPGDPLGTAGGLGNLRQWIDGRAVLVGNADAYLHSTVHDAGADIAALLEDWDGATVRLLGVPGPPKEFGAHRFAGFSLGGGGGVAPLKAEPADLVRAVWRPAERAARLEVVEYPGTYLDTGTPADYLRANLHAVPDGSLVAAGAEVTGVLDRAVIGAGAVVAGSVTRGVVWPGGIVAAGEMLTDGIRVGRELTVPAH